MGEEEKTGERVNFETRIEVFGGEEMWTTAAIPLSLGRIGRRPHLGHLGCLFGLAVECATARLSTRIGLIS